MSVPSSSPGVPPAQPPAPRPPARGVAAVVIGITAAAVGTLLILGFVILPLGQVPVPTVVLSVAQPIGETGSATVKIASASAAYGPQFYRVNIALGGVNGTSMQMPSQGNATVYVPAQGHTFAVRWGDLGGGGRLTAGDIFSVSPVGGGTIPTGTGLRFTLLWSSNVTIASATWTVPGPKPIVVFTGPSPSYSTVTFFVAGASPVVPIASYAFDLSFNGSRAVSPAGLTAGTNQITVAGRTYWVNFTDVSGTGDLNPGDLFRVTPQPGGSAFSAGTYLFYLIWTADASTVSTESWSMSRPMVTFTSASVSNSTVWFQVSSTSLGAPIGAYKFNLFVNNVSAATAIALASGTNQITVGGTAFWVNYTDISGNGNLKAGDVIQVQAQPAGAYLPAGSYAFYLVWATDGGTVQTVYWTI